ncbi:CRAL-TRIO domain-containing protein [Pelagophyceae sp. CCMP2097]|nr:CRAL-TRIO domain-containing protein [Pelagophyceae sp. CCMP2097]
MPPMQQQQYEQSPAAPTWWTTPMGPEPVAETPQWDEEAKQQWRDAQKEQREWADMRSRFPPNVEDATLKRFLLARQGDAEPAAAMLEASLRWRRAYGCPVDPNAVAHQLALGTLFRAGSDYEGRPVLYHFGSVPPNATPEQIALAVRAAVFWMDVATAASPDGKVTVVICRNPQAAHRPSLAYPRQLAKILELNFPESLHKAVIWPCDVGFKTLWGIASRFVDAKTRNKIALVTDAPEITKFVPRAELLTFLGGANRYQFQLSHVPGLHPDYARMQQQQMPQIQAPPQQMPPQMQQMPPQMQQQQQPRYAPPPQGMPPQGMPPQGPPPQYAQKQYSQPPQYSQQPPRAPPPQGMAPQYQQQYSQPPPGYVASEAQETPDPFLDEHYQ